MRRKWTEFMLDSDILKELVCYRCFCRISMTASFCENSKELCVRSWDCEKSSKQQYSKLKSQIVQKHRFTTKEGFLNAWGGKETFVNRLQSTTTVQPLRNTNGGWILWRVIARVKTGIRNSFPSVLPQFKSGLWEPGLALVARKCWGIRNLEPSKMRYLA